MWPHQMTTTPHPLLDLYDARIEEEGRTPDSSQRAAIAVLDRCRDNLVKDAQKHTGKNNMAHRVLSLFSRHDRPQKHGVYIYGPVGRGKTYASDLFFESIPDTIPKMRVHFHAFMRDVHAFLHTLRQEGEKRGQKGVDDLLPQYARNLSSRTRVICFDEFHVMDVADAMLLSRLFTALFRAGIVCVMTSNWAPADLYQNGLQRELFLPFIDFIHAKMDIVHVDGGQDYRRQSESLFNVNGTYFYPLGDLSDAALAARFDTARGDIQPAAKTIEVQGRTLTFERAAGRCVFVSFAEICERPLGPADYLMLADTFDHVFLDQVPRLTYDRRNETKRLITLIDILYEKRVRLVMAAAAAPDKLYVDAGHAFEFDRTVSRLIEMGTDAYGKSAPSL